MIHFLVCVCGSVLGKSFSWFSWLVSSPGAWHGLVVLDSGRSFMQNDEKLCQGLGAMEVSLLDSISGAGYECVHPCSHWFEGRLLAIHLFLYFSIIVMEIMLFDVLEPCILIWFGVIGGTMSILYVAPVLCFYLWFGD